MKVSLNTIRQFIDFELPPVDELVSRINQRLGQIEDVVDLEQKYKDVVVVKIVSAEKHPNADRLSVCLIDDGGVVSDVVRNSDGLVQVVCGAPNAREGILAAWLPPRSTVPSSYGTAEPFVLDTRELRGVMSNGMLAAADELALGGDHSGIIEINPDEQTPYSVDIKPGASFSLAYGLNDTVIDIENKMFTHRPDLFGQLGVAREIAGILGRQFKSPDWYNLTPELGTGEGLTLNVFNDAGEKCPRFMAVALKNVTIKSSPLWLQIELVRLGGKPINNIVDLTNYIMLLTAQPTHAYDYDKLRGGALGVRMANAGETATLLNGKSYTLTEDDIVIADGEGIVGLGGVMGGGNSEVSEHTTNIVLEVATFDMYAIRKTSMRHGLFTDAVTRFNKGQSPHQNPAVLTQLASCITNDAGGQRASEVYDMKSNGEDMRLETVQVTSDFINKRLGLTLTDEQVKALLANVEVEYSLTDNQVAHHQVISPFWRTDIGLAEDVVEEVGRLYGFDALPRELPNRTITPAPQNSRLLVKQRIRNALMLAGANEVLTYSFVHERVFASAGQDVKNAYTLSNALSPDLQHYRLSVLPSLLDKVHMDIKAGFDEFALFEIGKSHSKALGLDGEGLPHEKEYIDLVLARKQPLEGAAYYQARSIVEFLARNLGIEAKYRPISEARNDDAWAPFELGRSAILESRDGIYLGIVGELRADVRTKFKLPEYVAAFSLSIEALESAIPPLGAQYNKLSRYPSISRDISLRVASETTYDKLYHSVWHTVASHGAEIDVALEPVSIYQSPEETDYKTVTFHIELNNANRTMQDSDANSLVNSIVADAGDALGAELV